MQEEIPKWALPAPIDVDPAANRTVAAAIRSKANAKAKAKASAKSQAKASAKSQAKPKEVPKPKKKTEKSEKDQKKQKKQDSEQKLVHGQSLYGKAKQDFKESYSGSKTDFEKSWRESPECQKVLRQMPWSEVKKRKLDHLWKEDLDWPPRLITAFFTG